MESGRIANISKEKVKTEDYLLIYRNLYSKAISFNIFKLYLKYIYYI